MKYVLLGDRAQARLQAEHMFSSLRPLNLRMPNKSLIKNWLDEDWTQFRKNLKKTFESFWSTLKRNREAIEGPDGVITVRLKDRSRKVGWPFPEIALAILSNEAGIDVPTDVLWLPEALLNKQ